MKLDQRHEQQRECGQQGKRNLKVLGKKETTKTKHPSHEHHHLKLARRVCLQNLKSYENNKERYARLNAFQGSVTGEDREERRGREQQLQSCKAKTVTSWLHPKLQCNREQKNPRNPAHQRTEHGGQCEEQCGRQPKQRPSWNTSIPLTPAHALTHAR